MLHLRDFTLIQYKKLLQTIQSHKIPIYCMLDWVQRHPSFGIVIRHDIDRKPTNALKVARLEHSMGIKTTYYFRITRNSFNEHIIKNISRLNHEIGYHYEDLSLARGDYTKAIELFSEHLTRLRKIASVKTIAMHGRPFSPYDNKALWQKYRLVDFDLEADAFVNVNYSDMYYCTDTGRVWGETKVNLRDRVPSIPLPALKSTDDLKQFLIDHRDKKIALAIHPERWNDQALAWWIQLFQDRISNGIKYFLNAMRRN